MVYLKNADATKLATTLRAALAASMGSNAGGGAVSSSGPSSSGGGSGTGSTGLSGSGLMQTGSSGGMGGGMGGSSSAGGLGSSAGSLNSANSNQPSTGGQIQADPSTNSLIISAPEPQFRQLRAVIDQLDGRRAQVLVESLIVEVAANKVADFGIQWRG